MTLGMLWILVSCEKEQELFPREYPRLKTLPVTNITSGGATLNAEFQLRGDIQINNYGFVWFLHQNAFPTLENANQIVVSENIVSDNFSISIGSGFAEGETYDLRAFVQVNDHVVYGEKISFRSLGSNGPELSGFFPKRGHLSDTLRITGQDFGVYDYDIKVQVGELDAPLIDFSPNEFTVLLPEELDGERSTVSVFRAGNSSTFDDEFLLLKPTVDTVVAPGGISYGSEVVIRGTNFNPLPGQVGIQFRFPKGNLLPDENFSEYPAEITSISETQIITRIPERVSSKELELVIFQNNYEVVGDQKLVLSDPEIESILPLSGKTLSKITIKGSHFSPVTENNIVRIDGYQAEIVEASTNELVVRIPDQEQHIYSSREASVEVEVLSGQAMAAETFIVTDKWFRLPDLPFNQVAWKGLAIGQSGFVLMDGGNWRFDSTSGQWSALTAFPETRRFWPGIFAIDNKIFLGAGHNPFTNTNHKDFWEYDIPSDTWTRKADFPGSGRTQPLAFSFGSEGFLGVGGFYSSYSCCSGFADIWKYDPLADIWLRVADHPSGNLRGIRLLHSATLVGEVYVGLGSSTIQGATNDEFYSYDPVSDQWTRIADYPLNGNYGHGPGVSFTIGNQVYFGSLAFPGNIAIYDGMTWTVQDVPRGIRHEGFCFVIDDIAYMNGGLFGRQFWTFDPSRPD